MAQAPQNQELTERFIQFYRNYYRDEIGRLAQRYPNEQRSLYVDYDDLSTFDPDLADDYLTKPDQFQRIAEEALRLYDLPADVSLGQAHVRLRNIPETIDIRNIRVHDDHIGKLVSVQGIVRKATDVRPKITEAAFECQRCGTMTHIPQQDSGFQEPHECQGCERQGPFRVNFDQSEFVDSQKIRVQESPEDLRGGETPQSIDINIEDDITGKVTAGDHVTLNGVLHIEQQTSNNEKTPIFDLYMDGVSITVEDEEFEDMEITEEDKQEIVELSTHPDIYDQMVASVAPSIYGYDQEKLSMILQLFSGVSKELPDGSRIRGDLHMLLIGDPGTGKCLKSDTRVTMADGSEREIGPLVEAHLENPTPVDDGVWDYVDFEVPSLRPDGTIALQRATRVWRRDAPDVMYRIRTTSGREVTVTPSHPLFVRSDGNPVAVRADRLSPGDVVATAPDCGGLPTEPVTDGGTQMYTSTAVTDISATPPGGRCSWDRIDSIVTVDSDDEWVYDLEVEGTHSYLSNGIVSHNSQLLSYIRHIAPRSVYTSGKGSSAAGLCVTGNTLLHTESGFRRIQDIVAEEIPDPVSTETAVEQPVPVYTFDRERGEFDCLDSSHVWRMPPKPCRRIETSHGKTLEASTNTPVLTCGENGVEWLSISEVEPGDYVAVPRYDDIERKEIPVRDYLDLTNEKVLLTDASTKFVRRGLREAYGTLRDAAAALDLAEDFVYDSLPNRHVPLDKLDAMLDAFGAGRDDVDFERLMLRHGDSIAVPDSFDADLMYLLGLVFGDGDLSLDRRDGNRGLVRLSNGDETLLRRAADIFAAKFDKHVEIERQEERVPCIRINSATIARLFANAGMESPKQELSLDPRLTTSEHADAFLRGLMDADGSVSERDTGGSSVLLSTISDELARQIVLMLETYGIRARTRERDRRGTYELSDGRTIESKHVQHFVELYGADIDRYADAIGFDVADKQAALERATRDVPRREETIPLGSALAHAGGPSGSYFQNLNRGDNPGRGRARAMMTDLDLGSVEPLVEEAVDADLRWDEVVAAVDTGEKEVYDLTVPETHNFVGNGIVTHNTAAAVRDDFGDGQQWTLEAGALVLADKGIAAVDELDKMRCVTGETLVHLADGRIERIGDLARQASASGVIEELPNGRTIRDFDADLTVWTMAEDGRLVERPVTAIHAYDAPDELTEVRLQPGERLTSTHDHPYFVFEDGERVERAASDLSEDDWVYVPRALPHSAADGGTVLDSTAPSPTLDIDPGHRALGAVLGYLSGDGNVYYDREAGTYGIRFTNGEEELLADFERACRLAFGAEPNRPPSEQRDDGVETVRLTGRTYADRVLEAGMNLETYEDKSFPTGLTSLGHESKAAFVRALADSEGCVDETTGNVKIYSASYDLLLGTKSLLTEFGVSSQIQTRERDDGLDIFVLAVTAADSIESFARHIGFTLQRKAEALRAVIGAASGDRTNLDVIPDCGSILARCRKSLRLHQSECGLASGTYCDFENGRANLSLRLARRVLNAFEARQAQANADLDALGDSPTWETLARLKDHYHVSQRELASCSQFTQQQVSRHWGGREDLRKTVTSRLQELLESVEETDISAFRSFVTGGVKWRRVSDVADVTADRVDDRIPVLREELADVLGCSSDVAVERGRELLAGEPSASSWSELRDELARHDVSHASVAMALGTNQSTVTRWLNERVTTNRFDEARSAVFDCLGETRVSVQQLLNEIDERRQSKVYDLTVEGTHNFVANGMIVHNSEDRSAMHEALEQQQISISKAGINATLKSRCSLLGAANPKYGRFDQYEPIGEQIDLEPALISRFDLIFTVTDQPDPEKDGDLADHILQTNYAGELNTQRTRMTNSNFTQEEVDAATEKVEPAIEPDLLRKYIAHAKRNCYPTMTDEARAAIREFYVDLRARGADEDAPVPVTARKLEALVRLAEASARVRLSDTVDREDAERVIEIVRSCLEAIGVDPETGEFDADVIETGRSKTQRDRIKNLKGLISQLEAEFENGAPLDEVLDQAETELGLDRAKAEDEIEKLRRKGELYEPHQDHLRTT